MGVRKVRPLYEGEEDRRHEEEARKEISLLWDMDIYKCPRRYPVDFQMFDKSGMCLGFGEFKRRGNYSSAWLADNGYKISLLKWIEMKNMATYTGLEVVLFVRSGDGDLWWISVDSTCDIEIDRFSSSKRSDDQDIEPAVNISFGDFKIVEESLAIQYELSGEDTPEGSIN